MSVPPDGLLIEIDVDLFGLKIFLDAPRAEFAAKAGLLVAAPGRFDVRWLHVIYPYDSGAESFYYSKGFEYVPRPNGGCEPIRRRVGDANGIRLTLEWDDGGYGAENFLLCNPGGIVYVIEYRGFHVVALRETRGTSATRGKFCLFLAEVLIRPHPIELVFTNEGAHFCFAIQRRAQSDGIRFGGHRFDKLAVNRLLDEDAAASGANFSLIDENAEERAINRGFEIGIRKKYVRRFATELQSDTLHSIGSHFYNGFADRSTASERNFVYIGMPDERGTNGFAKPSDNVYHARRHTSLGKKVRELKRGERRLLGGLEDARATRGDRGRELPSSHQKRIVPGNDLRGDANWFAQ